jgi:DNA polymerase-3 subunit epsilon
MWWNGRALGLDFETDGPVPTEARIITGALVHLVPGVAPQEMETMLQPERDISQEAIDIHGITTERARDEGVLREVGIASIATTIAEHAGPEVPVVGHNAGGYDLTLLDRELRRLGLGRLEIEDNVFAQIQQVRMVLGERKVATFPVIDTLVLDKAVDPYRKGSRRLVGHSDVLRRADGRRHGARGHGRRDRLAADRHHDRQPQQVRRRTIFELATATGRRRRRDRCQAFDESPARSLADLHCAQVKWKAEQAEGLREYFRRKGTADPDKVSTDWADPARSARTRRSRPSARCSERREGTRMSDLRSKAEAAKSAAEQ